MKLFKNPTSKSNFLVFVFFLVLTIISITLSSCNNDVKPIIIKEIDEKKFDFSQDEGVSDSLVYDEWEPDSTYLINVQYNNSIKK